MKPPCRGAVLNQPRTFRVYAQEGQISEFALTHLYHKKLFFDKLFVTG
jgi:hypothetical protein